MKKALGFVTLLLALPLLGGCSGQNHVHTFSNEWSIDATKHWHAATCEHKDLRDSEANHIDQNEDYKCDVCGYVLADWSSEQKAIFEKHLYGYELPYIDGANLSWKSDIESVVLEKTDITKDRFNIYVDSIVSQGFSKEKGPYDDTYILIKEIDYKGLIRTIEVDIYINNETMNAVCYDPYFYEWPSDLINYYINNFFYVKPEVQVPSIEANGYIADTGTIGTSQSLIIYGKTNQDISESYKAKLESNGFNVDSARSEDGYVYAYDNIETIVLRYKYDTDLKLFVLEFAPNSKSWPAFIVDDLTDKITGSSGTRVPRVMGADSYEFIDVFDAHGYFFVLCESQNDLTAQYEAALDVNYTLYNEHKNTCGNYAAISDNNDLLVQYLYIVTESPSGGEDYKHFDVMFEPYYPHNDEHINAGIQIINKGSETTLPKYPGYGEKITFSDSDKYMDIMIQSCTYDSVGEYMNTLSETGWNVKDIASQMYNYEAISPERDIKLETSVLDGRVMLRLSAYEDPYKNWPAEGIQEILDTLHLEGEVPIFDGAYGYDYLNNEFRHEVICMVKINEEQNLIDAYNEKLVNLGWKRLVDGVTYYVKEGSNVGLRAYTEYVGSGYVFIEIFYGDGTNYDIDARTAFIDWKIALDIKSSATIPALNLTAGITNLVLTGDEGETYPGYYLFELLVDVDDGDISTACDEICTQFASAGWTYSTADHLYHNDIMWMTAKNSDGHVAIDVCAPIPTNDVFELIRSFVFDLDILEYINLPSSIDISDNYSAIVTKRDINYIDLEVQLLFESHDAANSAKTAIVNAFLNVGWAKNGSKDEYLDDKFMSSLKLVLALDEDSNTLVLKMVSPY